METTEKNRLIAQFMECEPRTDAADDRVLAYYIGDVIINADNSKNENDENVFHPDDMKFHTDWNWLMPVVEKIELDMGFDVYIHYNNCTITDGENAFENEAEPNQKTYATYQSVVEFIKWYNKQ